MFDNNVPLDDSGCTLYERLTEMEVAVDLPRNIATRESSRKNAEIPALIVLKLPNDSGTDQ